MHQSSLERLKLKVTGVVQGVGFRPYVYQLAHQCQLTGWVKNTPLGLEIEIQGEHIPLFLRDFKQKLPPLAQIKTLKIEPALPHLEETTFEIQKSEVGAGFAMISPDMAICDDCLNDLFDKNSRYYDYPFLNCTQCGPRLSVTEALPYDRENTAMHDFPLCHACGLDYSNPSHRRHHAQPTACQKCGPELSHTIDDAVQDILAGKIIAVKGLGGYQLICNARHPKAIQRLREGKARLEKPFALMVLNVQSAERIVTLDAPEKHLLTSPQRPIVVAPKNNLELEGIAPGLNTYGVMLPYTPLHYLLFHRCLGAPEGSAWFNQIHDLILVVTSANLPSEPLIIEDGEAQETLAAIADRVIAYNRKIVCRVDDSVVRVMDGRPSWIRKARGFVPEAIELTKELPPTIGLGGHLKNTFCITRGHEAFVSQHIGSLTNRKTIAFFHETITHFLKFLNVKPERVAHDLHPDFYTTKIAHEFGGMTFAVQHHHAHLASVCAEMKLSSPVLGLILDGYGYGQDGGAWGGELFKLEGLNFERLGAFLPLPQLGGELAIKEPWRMTASVLFDLGYSAQRIKHCIHEPQVACAINHLEQGFMPPKTSSCGRLFDVAACLLGLLQVSRYESQAPMLLESLVTEPKTLANGWQRQGFYLDFRPLLHYLMTLNDPLEGANIFHGTLISALAEWVHHHAHIHKMKTIVLSGGCFLNSILSLGLKNQLMQLGLTPIFPEQLPPNDGGLCLGQAWVAGQEHVSCA